MVGDVEVPLEFQINGFSAVATILTTSECFNLAFFFFKFEVDDFMYDNMEVGIVLKASSSTVS
jgi:hypothetical protein